MGAIMTTVGTQNQTTRELWLEKTLKKMPVGSRILDAGAGEQKYRRFCAHLNYVAQDFAQYNGQGNGAGLQMENWDQSNLDIISDVTAIPEPDASFDAVMCIEVFEHLPEPIKAIQEFARLLKPGGHLILTAPFCSLTHFAPYHFYTGFNRYFYETHLTANGFKIVDMQENTKLNISTKLLNRIGLHIILKLLNALSNENMGSEEMLCFGLHVLAKKSMH
jgi:ubiquinone/menaquinone biosynthesis C-methylase UbiE